jgi:hypothetical protein
MSQFNYVFLLSIAFLFVSCQETPTPTPNSSGGTTTSNWSTGSDDGGSGADGGGNSGDDGSSNGGGVGQGTTCYGDANDGDNSGMLPIVDYDISLAGLKDWVPSNPAATGMLTINEFSTPVFTSNYRLRFRLKMKSQPTTCPYKTSGTASFPYYTKLRFDVNFHTIDANNQPNTPFHTINNHGPVDVNACSQIFTMDQPGIPGDFPNPQTTGPIYISISNVKSDFDCQYYDLENDPDNYYYSYYCPAEVLARSKSCWSMGLQVVNDNTDDFK